MKETIRKHILDSGAVAVGFAKASPVPQEETILLKRFVEDGRHAGMEFLHRHVDLREDLRNVLPEVKALISCAFSYVPPIQRGPQLPAIADYALGKDYHDVIRRILTEAMEKISGSFPSVWRICIDSAPVSERWWALQAGIGKLGLNGSVIVEGAGSRCFLAEILTSLEIEPDITSDSRCMECGKCAKACPTGALRPDGSLDARRCINYLTIEHRGEWNGEGVEAMSTSEGRNSLFGCDICHNVCPCNRDLPPSRIKEFHATPRILGLNAQDALTMTQEEFSNLFRHSPIKRCKLEGLHRNAKNLTNN